MQYSDITTQLTATWNVGNIILPKMRDKNLIFNVKYPHYLFIQVFEAMSLKPITQTNDGGLVRRIQIGEIHGVYASYSDAKKALIEIKGSILSKKGWYVKGKSNIKHNKNVFLVILRFEERAYLQTNEW